MKRIFSAMALCLFALSFAQSQSSESALIGRAICVDYDEAGGLALIDSAKGDKDALLVKGIVLLYLAYYYEEKYLADSIAALDTAPESALATGCQGSALTVAGRNALKRGDLGTAMEKTQKGLELLNQALKAEPNNIWIHYLRLFDGLAVSRLSPFKQYDIISADVAFLAKLLDAGKLDSTFVAACECQIAEYWFDMKKVNRALDYWDKAAQAAPKSRYGKEAIKRLETLEG